MVSSAVFGFLFSSITLVHLALAQPYTPICKVVLDGRMATEATLEAFDSTTILNPYNPTFAKTPSVKWSKIIKFPATGPSVFDWKSKPLEVTINDKSIYQGQPAVRRANLVFRANTGTDDITNGGVKTFHWSVHQPPKGSRPVNLTHEYMNIYHVSDDSKKFHFQLAVGDFLKKKSTEPPITYWKVLDVKENVVFSTIMDFKQWQNFAITLDFNKNTLQAYYSKGNDELRDVTGALPNDNSGRGRFQIGMFKKPTSPGGAMSWGVNEYLTSGYQTSEFEESQIYGGIFVEDSANSCVTK